MAWGCLDEEEIWLTLGCCKRSSSNGRVSHWLLMQGLSTMQQTSAQRSSLASGGQKRDYLVRLTLCPSLISTGPKQSETMPTTLLPWLHFHHNVWWCKPCHLHLCTHFSLGASLSILLLPNKAMSNHPAWFSEQPFRCVICPTVRVRFSVWKSRTNQFA